MLVRKRPNTVDQGYDIDSLKIKIKIVSVALKNESRLQKLKGGGGKK